MNNYIDYRIIQIVVSYIWMVSCEYRRSQIERTMCALLDRYNITLQKYYMALADFFQNKFQKKREAKKGKGFSIKIDFDHSLLVFMTKECKIRLFVWTKNICHAKTWFAKFPSLKNRYRQWHQWLQTWRMEKITIVWQF